MGSEFDLIAAIRKRQGASVVPVGIGDDAALLPTVDQPLICTDMLVEGVHFRRSWSRPEDIGWKALAVNLSDIAAMGGRPRYYVCSLATPASMGNAWVMRFVEGMMACAQAQGDGDAPCLVGGDLSGSPDKVVVSVTVLGHGPPTGSISRDEAAPGDEIWVMGRLGLASVGLELLSSDAPVDGFDRALSAHRRPRPLVGVGKAIGHHGAASAMIDISDGLWQDLGHIAKASHVGLSLDLRRVEVEDEVRHHCADDKRCMERHLLTGGEDFALALTAPKVGRKQVQRIADEAGVPAQRIGLVVSSDDGDTVVGLDGQTIDQVGAGFEHF